MCNSRKRNQYGGWLLYFYWQLYAGVLLISVRTWDLLRLLRALILAQVVTSLVSCVLDVKMFPRNIALTLMFPLIPYCCRLAYFYRSKRVQHVFQLHDWDAAVETIHPATGIARLGI